MHPTYLFLGVPNTFEDEWVRPTYIFLGVPNTSEYPGVPYTIVGRAQWDWGYLLDISIYITIIFP